MKKTMMSLDNDYVLKMINCVFNRKLNKKKKKSLCYLWSRAHQSVSRTRVVIRMIEYDPAGSLSLEHGASLSLNKID